MNEIASPYTIDGRFPGTGNGAWLPWVGLVAGLLVTTVLSIGTGATSIPADEVVQSLLSPLFPDTFQVNSTHHLVIWSLRLPRVLVTLLIGAALSVAGVSTQAIFRNPIADPSLIGVASGATVMAVFMIVFGGLVSPWVPWLEFRWLLPVAAWIGGFVAIVLVWQLAQRGGVVSVPTMLLAGIAVTAICEAMTGVMVFLATDAQLRDITFWRFGSTGGASWFVLGVMALFMVPAMVVLVRQGIALNAFSLGEREAAHLGFNVKRTVWLCIGLAALLVGTSVAFCGIIMFVGLVVPHLVRLGGWADHEKLLPASMLGGAILLTVADTVARTVAAPVELPIGVLTAFLGGPIFLVLLLRARREWSV